MSSLDGDGSTVKPTADETVPRMSDTTGQELEYYKTNSFWSGTDDDDDCAELYCQRSCLLSPGIVSLLGLPVLVVGVWALVQGTNYFLIAMLPTTSVIIVSALLVIEGVVMVLVGIAYILLIRFSGARERDDKCSFVPIWFILCPAVLYFLPFMVVALGITAGALTPSLSETTQLSANTTFTNYLSDQSVQETFDNVQHNLKCCGVVAFTDYESIFNNLSVPVSCCNTTNPLANETTCPQIVSNAQQSNQTGLIYSEGCVPQLQSVLQYILSVVAGVSIMIGVLQILGNGMPLLILYLIGTVNK